MTAQNFKVTVIIPNYNHAPYLPQRIDSVLNQTFQDFEVLLLDDCSSDNSREIIAEYASRDPRIRVVLNEHNSGSTFKQWNKGIALAKGQYVWIAESDDYAELDFLATLVARLDENSRVGLAYCQSFSVDENGTPLLTGLLATATWAPFYTDLDPELWKNDFTLPGLGLVRRFMSYRNIIPNASAVLLRRAILEHVGPADESFRIVGDWLFWVKILAVCDASFVARPLNYFRSHLNNVRTKTRDDGTVLIEFTKLFAIMKQYGETAKDLYHRSLEDFFATWFEAFTHRQIPLARHLVVYSNLVALEPKIRLRMVRALRSLLMRNKFSGLRNLITHKVLRIPT